MVETQTNTNKTISISALSLSISSILVFIYADNIPLAKFIGPILFFIGLIISIVALKQSNKFMAYVSFLCLFIVLGLITHSVFNIYSPMPNPPQEIANLK